MLYLIAEDNYYYSEVQIKKLKEKYNKKEIIIFPEIEDVKNNISRGSEIAFLSPLAPGVLDARLKNNSFLETITLKNYYFPFTKDQIELNVDKNKVLSEKLGINITTPSVSFKDYGGSGKVLIDEAKKIELRFLFNLKPKGFFIVGIPGTGKSFFAKCFAGETGRQLVEFNISKIKEDPNPMEKIEMILGYFKTTPGKYLIWMDEIEKQFVDDSTTDILGVFLTELNEFQSGVSNVFFIATANNIERISAKYPELLRPGGRFDKLVSLLPSTEKDTDSIFNIYIKEKNEHYKKELFVTAFIKSLFPEVTPEIENTRVAKIATQIFENCKDLSAYIEIKKTILPWIAFYLDKENLYFDENQELNEAREFFNKGVLSKEDIYKKIVNKTRELIEEKNTKFYAFKSKIEKILNENSFLFPLEKAMSIISRKYRDKIVEKNRFSYTPSEISNIVNVVYTDYYLSLVNAEKTLDEIVDNVSRANIPIQIQFIEGIKAMAAQSENFFKV